MGLLSSTPEAQSRLLSQNGYAALKNGQAREALELFESANNLAKDSCLECQWMLEGRAAPAFHDEILG